MELTEEFSVCLSIYNEALSGVRVYLYTSFYSKERGKCQTEGNKIGREHGN